MFKDPVEQSFLKSNVVTGLFAFEPLMTEDLFALGDKLLVKERFFHEIGVIVRWGTHGAGKFHSLESSVNASAVKYFALTNLQDVCAHPNLTTDRRYCFTS